MTDTIDSLAGIAPDSALDIARRGRLEARRAAQESHDLLLHPDDPGAVSLAERRAVALFVAALHRQDAATAHYRALLDAVAPEAVAPVWREAERGRATGPYGRYPEGPLSAEDVEGPQFSVSPEEADALGPRLTAALEHAHLLMLHPRDASRAALQRLLDAGWTTQGIVTLSQLVSFLAFQIRVIQGLRLAQSARQSSLVSA